MSLHVDNVGRTDVDTTNARGAGLDVSVGLERRIIPRAASDGEPYPAATADNTG